MTADLPAAQPTTDEPAESPGSDDPDSSRSGEDAPIDIHLVLHTDEPDPPVTGWLDDQLVKATALAGVSHARLTIAVVQDAEMAELHEQYTGVTGTTDVLTFDLRDSAEGDSVPVKENPPSAIEGDIVVCIDEARRQAELRDHPLRHELLLYAVHGLMHLLGEDDHDPDAYLRMHAREDALLKKLGIGPVFGLPDKPESD